MYRQDEEQDTTNSLYNILEQIGNNLDTKYQATMTKILDKTNEHKPSNNRQDRRNNNDRNDRDRHQREDSRKERVPEKR